MYRALRMAAAAVEMRGSRHAAAPAAAPAAARARGARGHRMFGSCPRMIGRGCHSSTIRRRVTRGCGGANGASSFNPSRRRATPLPLFFARPFRRLLAAAAGRRRAAAAGRLAVDHARRAAWARLRTATFNRRLPAAAVAAAETVAARRFYRQLDRAFDTWAIVAAEDDSSDGGDDWYRAMEDGTAALVDPEAERAAAERAAAAAAARARRRRTHWTGS